MRRQKPLPAPYREGLFNGLSEIRRGLPFRTPRTAHTRIARRRGPFRAERLGKKDVIARAAAPSAAPSPTTPYASAVACSRICGANSPCSRPRPGQQRRARGRQPAGRPEHSAEPVNEHESPHARVERTVPVREPHRVRLGQHPQGQQSRKADARGHRPARRREAPHRAPSGRAPSRAARWNVARRNFRCGRGFRRGPPARGWGGVGCGFVCSA